MTRLVSEVANPDGLQDVGQVSLDFDPAHEKLLVHHIRVLRGGEVREIDPTRALTVFRRERDLERARYDGRLTAHMAIPDIRVGDIVDLAYSTLGAPPLFQGRFSAEWLFTWGCWVGETRVRVLSDAGRAFTVQTWNDAPAVSEQVLASGLVERRWRSTATPSVPGEADVPSWQRTTARVRLSDPMSWADVADTFRGFYEPQDLPDDLQALVAAIVEETPDPAARAAALLRTVQKALRYQAVSIGEGGFVPRPIAHIWGARSGDCKDASRLLVALLQSVGLDAAPALVNTLRGPALDQEAPSLAAFDHCVVRLRLDGQSWWLDPTRFPQGSDLARLHQAHHGWALPLCPGSELEPMGEEPVRDTWTVDERYELGPAPNLPATLTVTTTFGYWRAEGMRRTLAGGVAGTSKSYTDYYSRFYGAVTELAPMEITDDPAANELRMVERYSLAKPWEKALDSDELLFGPLDTLFAEQLTSQRTAARRWPIDVGLPRRASWTTTVRLPHAVKVSGWDHQFEIDAITARSAHAKSDEWGREIRLVRSIEVRRPFVPAADAEAYFDLRDSALRVSGVTVNHRVQNGRFVDPAPMRADRFTSIWRYVWVALLALWLLAQVFRLAGAAP
ncbi:MAG: hypothetical protein JWQ29_436 [Phenylobacterium sp.]|nr:hypothetical protein [Phenylobacterium sp.]